MNQYQDIIDEYFDPKSSELRREEIRESINLLEKDSKERILLILGEEIQLREKVMNFQGQLNQLENPSKRSFPYLKLAASITFLILISVFLFRHILSGSNEGKELYAAYYSPYPTMVLRNDDNSNLNLFFEYYKSEQYKKAENQLQSVISNQPNDDQLLIYLGNTYLLQEEFNLALIEFKKVKKEGKYYEHSAWYKALILIRLEKYDEAKISLKALIKEKSIYGKYAKELLHKMED